MAGHQCSDEYCESHAMSRNVMNYVKWKHKAQKSRQYCIMATIFMVASLLFVLFFVLLLTGVIPAEKNDDIKVTVTKEDFGVTKDNKKVERFILKNTVPGGIQLEVISLGCTITSIKVPDVSGHVADVVLGYDDLAGYESSERPWFGSVPGRFAGAIDNNRFTLDGRVYRVNNNDLSGYAPGGQKSWAKVVWNATLTNDGVVFSHVSPDGDDNFPGEIHAQVSFSLTDGNEILSSQTAEVRDKASPINMAIQPYFNLAGEGTDNIYGHEVTVFSDKYLVTNENLIPTGDEASVNNTVYDLRSPTRLSDRLGVTSPGQPFDGAGGYDHTYRVKGATGKILAARVRESSSGRVLDVFTDQAGVHLYTANSLSTMDGKDSHKYQKHSAICLTTQNYPDAINHPNFPDCILYPGSKYIHNTWYKFSTSA